MDRNESNHDKQYFTPKEWARHTRQTYRTVLEQIANNDLIAIDTSANPGVGRARFLIDIEDGMAWMDARKTAAPVVHGRARNVRRASRRYV